MLKKVLDLAANNGFLSRSKSLNDKFKIGPVGQLLCQNINSEWFHNIVINKELTVVINDGDLSETYNYVKNLCSEKLPFGIADSEKIKKYTADEYRENCDTGIDFKNLLCNEDDIFLKFCVFVSPNESMRYFQRWQKQRRIWYKKFSASPERYSVSDVKNIGNTQSVNIEAKYPWGSHTVESLELNSHDENFTNEQLQFKDGKLITAHTITSRIHLSTLFLNSLCDSYDEPFFQDKLRPLWRFHRKLAPYKLSFALTGSTQSILNELNDLGLYLCKQLRTNHVSTLFLPSASKSTLDSQYVQYDQLGIPYTVVLNERTLKDGIGSLRNRDTTLKEKVHVTELVSYVDKLFKNY